MIIGGYRRCVKLLDRELETSYLSTFLRSMSAPVLGRPNRGMLVYAGPGIGKTELIRHVLAAEEIVPLCVRLDYSNSSIIPPGYFFDALFSAFEKTMRGPLRREVDIPLEGQVGISVPIIPFLPSSPAINLGVAGNNSAGRKRKRKVKSMISQLRRNEGRGAPSVIYIEHSELLDRESCLLFKRIYENTESAAFIFEYSAGDNRGIDDALAFHNEFFFEGSAPEPLELEPLEFADAKCLPAEEGISVPERELEQMYRNARGNLRVFANSYRKSTKGYGKFKAEFQHDANLIGCLVAMNQEPVETNTLASFVGNTMDNSILNVALDYLERQGCVYREKSLVGVADSALIEGCFNDRPSAYAAYSAFLKHIESEPTDCASQFKVLNAQMRFGDEGVTATISKIKSIMCRNPLTEKFAIDAASIVNQAIRQRGWSQRKVIELEYSFFDAFLAAADYEHARVFLDGLREQNDFTELCRYVIDAASVDERGVAETTARLLDKHRGNLKVELYITLNYISYLMRFSKRNKVMSIADAVMSDESLKDFPEYYWIKKQRTVFLPTPEALSELAECINYFDECGCAAPYARTRITFALRLATTERASDSYEIFRNDYERGYDPLCPDGYYLNDMAACLLMQNKDLSNAVSLIEDALMYPATHYEQTLKKCNLLIALSLCRRYAEASDLFEQLYAAGEKTYQTDAFRHLYRTNMLMYCTRTDDSRKAEMRALLEDLGREASGDMSECVKSQLEGHPISNSNRYAYVAKRGYRPGFIGFWQMQMDHELVNALLAHSL